MSPRRAGTVLLPEILKHQTAGLCLRARNGGRGCGQPGCAWAAGFPAAAAKFASANWCKPHDSDVLAS